MPRKRIVPKHRRSFALDLDTEVAVLSVQNWEHRWGVDAEAAWAALAGRLGFDQLDYREALPTLAGVPDPR